MSRHASATRARIAHPAFDTVILGVILVNAVGLGLETYANLADRYHGLFSTLNNNSMEEARSADRAEHETDDLLARLRAARAALEDAERELQRAHRDDL